MFHRGKGCPLINVKVRQPKPILYARPNVVIVPTLEKEMRRRLGIPLAKLADHN